MENEKPDPVADALAALAAAAKPAPRPEPSRPPVDDAVLADFFEND